MSTLLLALGSFGAILALPCPEPFKNLGFYPPNCDSNGDLLPPAHFGSSLQLSMDAAVAYYAASPRDLPFAHGLPSFAWATFTDGIIPTSFDIIAGMQNGMGIFGYYKYVTRALAGRGGNATLALPSAIALGDYLTKWANTPAYGVWPNVTRSTGLNIEWPLTTASQGDIAFGVNCIETDRVGMAGYALLKLHEITGATPPDNTYLSQAIHNARVLAATQSPGNATHAPWPFRVDSVSGDFLNGHKNGESAFPLRLFLALSRPPYSMAEFSAPAASLWSWVKDFQLPTARVNVTPEECLFVNFFEDRTTTLDNNRNSWTALELARFLIEERGSGLDPEWSLHVEALLEYAYGLFGYPSGLGNVTLMGEQDDDRKGWGGASSKLGAVGAKFACAGGAKWWGGVGARNAAHMSYYTTIDGCRSAEAYLLGNATPTRGGWTEDGWLDVLVNVIDAAEAADGVC